ncbi:Na(+)/H(+) exchange regulatory cofactor NHE-RF3-like isoform X3 [Syngnathoides biaculeatus]|uniref:Na(+)/H(+) exchange regulatory cofactor NHE-RF3-like isoform X3 n=1 Tax=Syngnathoides biaculeatus TaxID=300417 RepID=UPI002ADD7CFB|nr:Na(+)/H(+) exchange regulatory cofactor NHE-RF3-like isoform X3 [Syngnathoides biaculeatus]
MKSIPGPQDSIELPCFTFNPKEGIDNPGLVVTDDFDRNPLPILYQLRRVEGQNFGFYLQNTTDKQGLEIKDIDPWSPAERSGLTEGDKVLEVNDEYVVNMDFFKVARKIQSCGLHLFLLVLKRDDYDQAVCTGVDLQMLATASKGGPCSRPRLCHINRHQHCGLGMTLISGQAGLKGHCVLSVGAGSPAEKAGVISGDRLVWMNGVITSNLTDVSINKSVISFGTWIKGVQQRRLEWRMEIFCWQSMENKWSSWSTMILSKGLENAVRESVLPLYPCKGDTSSERSVFLHCSFMMNSYTRMTVSSVRPEFKHHSHKDLEMLSSNRKMKMKKANLSKPGIEG